MKIKTILFSFLLAGCSSVPDNYVPEYGTINQVTLIGAKDYSPGKGTAIGAGSGAGSLRTHHHGELQGIVSRCL